MKICGIYKITSPSGRTYIGQSTDIKSRWRNYKGGYGYKEQTRLRRSMEKYGYDNHIFEVVVEAEEDDLNKLERYWQDHYDVLDRNKGMNCKLTATDAKKAKHSEETKSKISQGSPRKKSITQFTKEGKFIRTWGSSKECSEALNIPAACISSCLIGYSKSTNGFIFRYGILTDDIVPPDFTKKDKGVKRKKYTPRKNSILQFDLEGNFIKEWDNIKIAAKNLKLNSLFIGGVCRGVIDSYAGFIWKTK